MRSAKLLGTGFLPNFDLHFHKLSKKDGSGKCNIFAGNRGIYVAVFEILKSDRKALDRWEGLGAGYDHRLIEIEEFGECSTYVANPSAIDNTVIPYDWYKQYVMCGARYHGFPAEYLATLEAIVAGKDPDNARSEREWKSVDELKGGT